MLLDDLLAQMVATTRLSDRTVYVYRITLRQLGCCLGRPGCVSDLTDETLLRFERWFAAVKPHSAYTVRERSSRLKALWRFAARRGIVSIWPTVAPYPVPEICPRAWTVGELQQLAAAAGRMPGMVGSVPAGSWWLAWVVTAWWTGERTGALRRLCWDHVDPGRRLLDLPGTIRKNAKAATYVLPEDGMGLLLAIRSTSPLVFPWPKCDGMFFLSYNVLLRSAELPTGRKNQTQRIRRSHLTHWAASGGDATARAQHSSAGLTWRHYLDRTMLPQEKPEDRLPRIG